MQLELSDANTGGSSFVYLGGQIPIDASTLPNVDLPIDPNMPDLEDDSNVFPNDGIFSGAYDDEDVGAEADFNNMDNTIDVSPIPTLRVHKDHPKGQILGDPKSAVQTRGKIQKASSVQQALVSYIYNQNRTNHKDHQNCLLACFLSQEEPKTISQALEDESWVEAMQEELLQFKLQKVWILVDLPFGKKAIGTKWVFRNKRDERSIVVKNKARLIAQGFRQEEGIDYDEVFALVARIEAIRLFLAFASFMGFPVYQMDVKSAFLYGTIEEEVYVHQPLGFVDPAHPNKVYKVIKALYGLHQAPRAWYETLSSFLLKNGFRRGTIDKTLLSKKNNSDISSPSVKQQPDGIFISQDKYVADILKKFDFCSIKTATTLIASNKPLVKDEDGVDVDVHVYRSMIGSLMYLTASRPDIMFVVCACARLRATYGVELVSAASLVNTARPTLSTARLGKFGAVRQIWCCQANLVLSGKFGAARQIWCCQAKVFSMANLEFVDQHNMVACLEKTEGNSNFHKLVDFLASNSIHHALTINSTIDSKAVVVTEASIRSSLLFNDADGTACLTNESIFQNLALMGYEAEGEGSGEPIEPQPTPSPTQPSGHTSDRAEGALNLQELFVLCTNLSNKVLALESIKDAQATEISALKSRIKKLEKKCKPSISHHKAWLKSVKGLSMKKRFGQKESVSKQVRKKSKPESTLDDSTIFDDQDHGMEYMEIKEAMDEGRQSGETEEVKLIDDTEVVEDKGNGDKGGNAEELVSTARPEVSTARPDIDAARQEDSVVEPRTPPTTTSIFDDEDITMAQTLIKMKEEKANEKECQITYVKER
ncbi:putative ribonuclease H-like domain-containing protein [Tanacetum coccineum]